jgi:glutathione S-transferase
LGAELMLRVFGDVRSGNCLKVKGLLDWLGCPYAWADVDILAGGTRTAAFLALNPAGQIPFIQLEDGRGLAQSNAILLHLARGTSLLPEDPYDLARAYEWLFWEQYSHEPALAVRRFQKLYLNRDDHEIDPALLRRGYDAVARMETHLAQADWMVGSSPSVADLALLPYTALAPEGGFDLKASPAVCAWINRSLDVFGLSLSRPETLKGAIP